MRVLLFVLIILNSVVVWADEFYKKQHRLDKKEISVPINAAAGTAEYPEFIDLNGCNYLCLNLKMEVVNCCDFW
jgi:hypothetical protein